MVLIFFMQAFSLFAINQQTKARFVISTQFFDFIYPPDSHETAQFLAEHADSMVFEICSFLHADFPKKIPVYLDPSMQKLNANFSPYPYNRIVLYDTVATDGSLTVFKHGILMVFYHELTHAISMNIRTPFWQFVSQLFGDPISPATMFTMPLSFLEGVTVSLESSNGEGRLNDPLSLHYLRQDKIEGSFLSWKKSSGALDIYPGTKSSYLYGGAFSQWLQQNFGMEKYAEFWNKSAGFNPFKSHLEGRFKQTYKISLTKAWDNFSEDFYIPPINANIPEQVSGTQNGVISCLSSGPDGLVWLDTNTQAVWFRSKAGKTIRFFDADSHLERLSFSPDGRLLLVSGTVQDGSVFVQKLRIFDVSSRKFLSETWSNIRDASFMHDSKTIVGIETIAQRSSLIIIDRNDPALKKVLTQAGPNEPLYALYCPSYIGNAKIAFIGANGLERNIYFIDSRDLAIERLVLPPEVQFLHHLQSIKTMDSYDLSFSWAQKETLYRFGLYSITNQELVIQAEDFSGSVFYPVVDPPQNIVYYIASFSDYDSLRFLDPTTIQTQTITSVYTVPAVEKSATLAFPTSSPSAHLYNPLPWFFDGIFFPWANLTETQKLTIGFLYATGDPSGNFSVSIEPFFIPDPFFVNTRLSFQYQHRFAYFALNFQDWLYQSNTFLESQRSTALGFTLAVTKSLGTSWKKLSFTNTLIPRFFATEVDKYESPYQAPFRASLSSFDTSLILSLIKTNKIRQFPLFAVHSTGLETKLNAFFSVLHPRSSLYSAFQGQVRLQSPFIPLELSLSGFTSPDFVLGIDGIHIKKPTSLTFIPDFTSYLPTMSEYRNTSFENIQASNSIAVNAEIVPVRLEIQKGIPLLPLYTNRIILAGGYKGLLFFHDKNTLIDSFYVQARLQGTIIYGALSTVLLSGSATYSWPIREGKGNYLFSLSSSVGL